METKIVGTKVEEVIELIKKLEEAKGNKVEIKDIQATTIEDHETITEAISVLKVTEDEGYMLVFNFGNDNYLKIHKLFFSKEDYFFIHSKLDTSNLTVDKVEKALKEVPEIDKKEKENLKNRLSILQIQVDKQDCNALRGRLLYETSLGSSLINKEEATNNEIKVINDLRLIYKEIALGQRLSKTYKTLTEIDTVISSIAVKKAIEINLINDIRAIGNTLTRYLPEGDISPELKMTIKAVGEEKIKQILKALA